MKKIFFLFLVLFLFSACSLEKTEKQNISWKSCESEEFKNRFSENDYPSMLDCANFVVPLDYEDKNSKKITLALTRQKAFAKEAIWDLIVISGWPWQNSLNSATSYYEKNFNKLVANFNVIWFAPRWVFPSNPQIDCGIIEYENSEEIMKKCLENSEKNFLKNISTKEVVEDLEQIRIALWWKKISVLSYSYGTKVLWMYAEKYWKNLRAGILDSVVNLNEDMFTMLKNQEKSYQKTFEDFVSYCLTKENCIFEKEKWDFNLQFQNFLKNLDEKNLKTSYDENIYASDFLNIFYENLMWKDFWDENIFMLYDLKNWEIETYEKYFSDYLDNGMVYFWDKTFTDMSLSVINCADHSPKISFRNKEKYIKNQKERDEESKYDNFYEKEESEYLDLCFYWPFDWKDVVKIPKKQLWTPKLLFISHTSDPSTPYENAVNMAKYFNSPLLTKTWNWHSISFTASDSCIDEKALEYLFNPEKKFENFTCK